MQIRISNVSSKILCIVLLSIFLWGCQTSKKKVDEYAQYEGKDPHNIFVMGENALRDGRYSDAVKYFTAIETLYPYAPDAEQAKLDSIYANYKREEFSTVISDAKRFLRFYPASSKADYAQYMQGLAYIEIGHGPFVRYLPLNIAERDLVNERVAFTTFNELLKRYPHSRYAAEVRARLIYLRNLLAKQEVAIADYYMRRGAYVAAINRANYVIEHFPKTSSTRNALVILHKAYKRLKMQDRALQVQKLLQTNYTK